MIMFFSEILRRFKLIISIAVLILAVLILLIAINMLSVIEPSLPKSGAVEEAVDQLIILPGRGLIEKSFGRFAIMHGSTLVAESDNRSETKSEDPETKGTGGTAFDKLEPDDGMAQDEDKPDNGEVGLEDGKSEDEEAMASDDLGEEDDKSDVIEDIDADELGPDEGMNQDEDEGDTGELALEEGQSEVKDDIDSDELGSDDGDLAEEESDYKSTFFGSQTDGTEHHDMDDFDEQYFHLPLFEIIGTQEITYLRTEVGEIYINGWDSYGKVPSAQYHGEIIDHGIDAAKIDQKEISIKPIEPLSNFLPVVIYTNQLVGPEEYLTYFPESQVFYSGFPLEDTYEFSVNFYDFEKLLMESILIDETYEYSQYCNTLLDKTIQLQDDRLTDLAYRITDQEQPDNYSLYEKAVKIKEYLQSNYHYKHSYFLTNHSYDHIEKFLFIRKEGSVVDFNTSFTLLSRELSIPARIVLGYRIDPEKEYQVVYTDQAYAFSEIYIKGFGWLVFDAAPVYQFYHPPMVTYSWIDEANDIIIKGETLSIEGQVVDTTSNAIDGLKILIYLRENPTDASLSYNQTDLIEGNYFSEFVVDKNVSVGHKYVVAKVLENDFYKTSLVYKPITIFSETNIELFMPDRVFLGNDIQISCLLTEKVTPDPLVSEKIILTLQADSGETIEGVEGITDEKGVVEFNLQTDFIQTDQSFFGLQLLEKRPITAFVTFDGTEFYFASEATGETTIWIFYWYRALVLLVITILVVGFGIIKLYQYWTTRKPEPVIIPEPAGNIAIAEKTPEPEYSLFIEFPEIYEPFPPVWGFNEVLTIKLVSAEKFLGSKVLQMAFGDGRQENLAFENKTELNHCYMEKGSFNLMASKTEETEIIGSTNIKIVDYREEIIESAKNIFKTLHQIDTTLSNKLTPRELLSKGLKGAPTITKKDRAAMVMLLEYAIYSLKAISRKDYEKFYLLSITVNNYLEGLS